MTTGGCRAPRVLELSSDTLPTFSAEGGSTEQTFDSSFQKPEKRKTTITICGNRAISQKRNKKKKLCHAVIAL